MRPETEDPQSRPVRGLHCPPELEGIRVLVVEDEPDARDLLRQLLEQCGIEVTDASSADKALSAIDQQRFDAIVSDIGLPDTDGYTFLRTLRARPAARGGRIPAIALSAYTRLHDRTEALDAGFHFHVAKPVDATELLAILASLIRRRDP